MAKKGLRKALEELVAAALPFSRGQGLIVKELVRAIEQAEKSLKVRKS